MSNSVRADLLKSLVRMHAEGDEAGFRKTALQVAAAESAAGHTKVAQQIREILASLSPASARSTVVDIAQPRGPLADVLDAGHRPERLEDIVLAREVRTTLQRVLQENRSRTRLQGFGVSPRRRLLFHGPPGCGKTLAASVLAGELGVPLMTVRFDALFSRFLGATANHLRARARLPIPPTQTAGGRWRRVESRQRQLQVGGDQRRYGWALRIVAAGILLAYAGYVVAESVAWWHGKAFGLVSRRAETNLRNALWGLVVFGLPSLYSLLKGTSGTRVDVLVDVENKPEDEPALGGAVERDAGADEARLERGVPSSSERSS